MFGFRSGLTKKIYGFFGFGSTKLRSGLGLFKGKMFTKAVVLRTDDGDKTIIQSECLAVHFQPTRAAYGPVHNRHAVYKT